MINNSWKLVKFGSFLYFVNTYVFEVTMCVGPSMLPTFSSAGDIVLVDRISPQLLKINKGDIVIAQSPTNPRQTVCKRVKGMPGERVRVAKRYPYERDRVVKIPKGRVWLEGDNPRNSTDSRSYGAVPMGLIKGRVFFRLWPLTDIGPVY
mmetsp:Transcript_16765/g.32644  ORF Transcript_16765/g.32644 Transcript_16765/m.32644 type:complete len:150 (+) Transcript_16765:424-873(+)|eukprot:CAMPEP_0171543592 /NCGR_PEP_ID=MMETSP0960-20121227/3019_1 /TAXON_ID=87120 /ORGANISM="Aurantiochytrium limacinum, Strain ATCCMYA-1381" /LENGTH=149 /DNA_ID=CAMNT_0012091283 /DNA_START=324 /DNA_END=773 /DNA_ORIENTATION=-